MESTSMSVADFILEKGSFFSKIPMLMNATLDNPNPTPGYLLNEINDMTYRYMNTSYDLVDWLNKRLSKKSQWIKFKVLKIMKHLIEKGHASFRDSLRKSSTLISETTKFNVHAHSLHGVTTCQQIRSEAKEILRTLYTDGEDRGTAAGDDGIDGGGGGKGCGGGVSGSDTQKISDQKVYIGIDSRAVTNSTIMGFGHTMPIHNTFSNLVYNTMSDLADRVVEMTSGNREPITFYDSRDTGLHAVSKAKSTPSDGNTTTTITTPTTAIAANTAAAATTTATIAATTTTTADVVDDDGGEIGNVLKNEFSSLEEEILLMNYLRSTADYQNINKQLHEIIGSCSKDALILFINNRLSKKHKKHHDDDDGDGGGDDDNGEEDDDAVENDDGDKKLLLLIESLVNCSRDVQRITDTCSSNVYHLYRGHQSVKAKKVLLIMDRLSRLPTTIRIN